MKYKKINFSYCMIQALFYLKGNNKKRSKYTFSVLLLNNRA